MGSACSHSPQSQQPQSDIKHQKNGENDSSSSGGEDSFASKERSCAEALMMACDERLGAQSPAALMVCDTFLARDLWMGFVHERTARNVFAWGLIGAALVYRGSGCKRSPPERISELCNHRTKGVAASRGEFCVALLSTGRALSWGRNGFGQLSHRGTSADCHAPRTISLLKGCAVAAVACGNAHSLFLLETGQMLACGRNHRGQCGVGFVSKCCGLRGVEVLSSGVAAESALRVLDVACGRSFSVALLASGELLVWGENTRGQLGLGDQSPAAVTSPRRLAAAGGAGMRGMGVRAIACGDHHSVALLCSGAVASWGHNRHGQLGLGDKADRAAPTDCTGLTGLDVKAVACGGRHSLALLATGAVRACGDNGEGQLGVTCCCDDAGDCVTFQEVAGLPSAAEAVSCGTEHSVALLRAGSVFAWGGNYFGQLGLGDNKSRPTPQHVAALENIHAITTGSFHTIALS